MKTKSFLGLLFVTTLLLMVVALYNGFPLTESDTGAYIEKGILGIIPQDRSPFYGWFMRYTSLWTSLWFTVFVQCFILSYVLLKFIIFLDPHPSQASASTGGINSTEQIPNSKFQIPNSFNYRLVTVIVIITVTCVAWVAGYLMPDIFAGILLLAILLYLFDEDGGKGALTFYAVLIFMAIIIHNSHFLITAIFSTALIIWALVKRYAVLLKRSIVLLSLSVLSWLLMCTVNAANGYDFTFSRGSHVFMVTKFA